MAAVRVALTVLVMSTGCRAVFGLDSPVLVDGSTSDALDACPSFSSQVETCTLSFGPALALAGNSTFNTDTKQLVSAATQAPVTSYSVTGPAGPLVIIAVDGSFTLAAGASLRVIGSKPFGLIVRGTVSLEGTIDLVGGAGARTCDAGAGQNDTGGAGGGGGGGFAGNGGGGGPGDQDTTSSAGGAAGNKMTRPAGPLGGCRGGAGGDGTAGGGNGGIGGGAIVIAATQIDIADAGGITAGGSGGRGAPVPLLGGNGGGGGGGSGGFILLEASTLAISGKLAANGGGGGEGADGSTPGNAGSAGLLSAMPASGGAGGAPEGGDGGEGGAGMISDGASVTTLLKGGGGGGGGGVGFIAIAAPQSTITGVISPPSMSWP